jgi:glucose-6-phosphate 1-dehydrogenase
VGPAERGGVSANRLFYFAIPPSVFAATAASIKASCCTGDRGWDRIVVEKPFGTDLESSETLARDIAVSFREDQIYRIDHYLGKEMVQNLMVLRFANSIWEPLWNREHISSVQIIFKEDLSVEGRGGYFDPVGILRDVMQNHLMQILSLVAMEPPVSFLGEDIRDEKVKVLRCIKPVHLGAHGDASSTSDVVLGQYAKSAEGVGYRDDPTVPDGSLTPTFAAAVFKIKNARWRGVPFVVSCGKGLEERMAEIRIQFKESPVPVFEHVARNELVIRVQPDAGIYLRTNVKMPGLAPKITVAELDLTYGTSYPDAATPDAYERLILDVLQGSHAQFVRRDELRASWAIFTPLLHAIDRGEHAGALRSYPFRSEGPAEFRALLKRHGVVQTGPGGRLNRREVWEGDERDALFCASAGGSPEAKRPRAARAEFVARTGPAGEVLTPEGASR